MTDSKRDFDHNLLKLYTFQLLHYKKYDYSVNFQTQCMWLQHWGWQIVQTFFFNLHYSKSRNRLGLKHSQSGHLLERSLRTLGSEIPWWLERMN
jgi:hypothetical protein